MNQKTKPTRSQLLAFFLALVVFAGTLFTGQTAVYAADGTLHYQTGKQIPYGSYATTEMFIDGDNTAYCVQPLKKTPADGTYSYQLLGTDSPLRKALYYLPGGYGYEHQIKDAYLSGWSDDNCYVIGHLVTAYIYADYDANSGAFHGAPQNFIDKAVEVANVIKTLADPPTSFRAFIIPSENDQTIAGSWYQVPYGWIELKKSTANAAVSEGNENYSLAGAEYGIFLGDKQVDILKTDETGYAKSKELEVLDSGHYTIRELKASKGFAIDTNSYDVKVKAETGTEVAVKEIPQNNPMELLLQKIDEELQTAEPQGGASLAGAEFTVCFYTRQSDNNPAESGEKPEQIGRASCRERV